MKKDKFPYRRGLHNHDFFDDLFDDFWLQTPRKQYFNLFDEFEEQFRRMQQRMNNLYRETLRGDLRNTENGNLHIYGWTFKLGSDGKPVFQEFGNIPQTPPYTPEELPGSREPLIDVQETEKQITVIAEIPGVSKEDVDLEITTDNLTIKVDNENRKYYKEISLPAEIDTNSGQAKFNNGVLSITLQKLKPKKKGKKIKVR